MRRLVAVPAATAALLLFTGAPAAGAQQGGEEPLTVTVVRFYQPDGGTTTIEGVCELRLAALSGGSGGAVRYRFEVAVLDSTGLELQRSDWEREVGSRVASARGATAMESFGFAAAPGSYRVRLRAVPRSGPALEREVPVTAFARRPEMSDLLLATGESRPVADTGALQPGEIRRAGLAMRTAPLPRLNPMDAALTYYAEVYPWTGAVLAGELRVDVLSGGARVIVSTPARSIQLPQGGGVSRGSVNLAGLPEGDYRLRLRVRLGDSTLVAEAPFRMGSLAVAARLQEPAVEEADLFADLAEERLDSLYAPLEYILDSQTEAGVYQRLSVDGKRRFLREFWRRRDPTPADADNPRLVEFYRQVAYANDAFRQAREGRAGATEGWRTDRGRIYLRHGRPDEVLRRPVASPRPYEVWKYTRDRAYWYVFFDRSGLGDYALIGTNDRREPGLQEWDRYLGLDNAEDVRRFLGLQVLTDQL